MEFDMPTTYTYNGAMCNPIASTQKPTKNQDQYDLYLVIDKTQVQVQVALATTSSKNRSRTRCRKRRITKYALLQVIRVQPLLSPLSNEFGFVVPLTVLFQLEPHSIVDQ